jgi:hypothetical protein
MIWRIILIQLVLITVSFLVKAQPCTDLKYIKLNIHFMLKSDGTGNYTEYDNGKIPANPARNGFWYAQALIDASNSRLANNQPMHLPHPNNTPNLPTNIRVALSGVYFHRDDQYYYYTLANKTSGKVNDTYGVNKNSELNIFVQQDTTTGGFGGIACGLGYSKAFCNTPWIKLTGVWVSPSEIIGGSSDQMGATMNHEIGHVLGLSHSWIGDLCQDTPDHKPEWCLNDPPKMGSNNFMDYNCWANAITPCQLDIMHHQLENYYSRFFVCCTDYPLTAPFYIRPMIPSNKSVMLDGSWRTSKSETDYSIEINQTDAYGSQVNSGNYFFQKIYGQYELIDLASIYKFVPGTFYKIKLTVRGRNCNDSDSEEVWIKVVHSNILEQYKEYKEWRKKKNSK